MSAYEIGKAFLGLGRIDEAVSWLQRAIEERSHSMVFMRVDPQLEAFRSTPRFDELAQRVWPDSVLR